MEEFNQWKEEHTEQKWRKKTPAELKSILKYVIKKNDINSLNSILLSHSFEPFFFELLIRLINTNTPRKILDVLHKNIDFIYFINKNKDYEDKFFKIYNLKHNIKPKEIVQKIKPKPRNIVVNETLHKTNIESSENEDIFNELNLTGNDISIYIQETALQINRNNPYLRRFINSHFNLIHFKSRNLLLEIDYFNRDEIFNLILNNIICQNYLNHDYPDQYNMKFISDSFGIIHEYFSSENESILNILVEELSFLMKKEELIELYQKLRISENIISYRDKLKLFQSLIKANPFLINNLSAFDKEFNYYVNNAY